MNPVEIAALILVVLFAGTFLIRQFLSGDIIDDLDPLTDDWMVRR